MYPSIYLYIYLSLYICIYLSACLSFCMSVYLSICLSVCLSIYLSLFLCVYACLYLSISVSFYLFLCLDIHPSTFLSVCLYLVCSPLCAFNNKLYSEHNGLYSVLCCLSVKRCHCVHSLVYFTCVFHLCISLHVIRDRKQFSHTCFTFYCSLVGTSEPII